MEEISNSLATEVVFGKWSLALSLWDPQSALYYYTQYEGRRTNLISKIYP